MPISFVTHRLQVLVRCNDDAGGVEVEFEEGEALATKCRAQGQGGPGFSTVDLSPIWAIETM